MYRGDIALGSTIDLKFTTRSFTTGVPTTLSGSPAVSAYVDNGTTEITSGVTLSVDFDSRTGLNNVRVVASGGNGFAASTNVDLVITAGTVGGVSVVGEVIGSFSINNRVTDVTKWNGTAVATPATAGVPDVNAKNINNVATTSVTTVNANLGTTQPVNFTGTAGSALLKSDTIDWNSVAVTGMPMPTYTQPTGFLAATFPATVASTTNITSATVTLADGVTHGGTTAKLRLGSSSSSTPAFYVTNTHLTAGSAVRFEATGGIGFFTVGGSAGTEYSCSNDGPGFEAIGAGSGAGFFSNGGTTGAGWSISGGSSSGDAISLTTPAGRYITQAAEDEIATRVWASGTRTVTSAANITSTGGTTVPQTGDSFARIGATGSGLTSLAQASTALSTVQWTNALATALTTLGGHDPGSTLASAAAVAAVQSDTDNIQTRLPASLVGGRMSSDVGSINSTDVTGDGSTGNPWGPA